MFAYSCAFILCSYLALMAAFGEQVSGSGAQVQPACVSGGHGVSEPAVPGCSSAQGQPDEGASLHLPVHSQGLRHLRPARKPLETWCGWTNWKSALSYCILHSRFLMPRWDVSLHARVNMNCMKKDSPLMVARSGWPSGGCRGTWPGAAGDQG